MPGPQTLRLELILSRPPIGWYPKPTVVVAGRGQPAQWGVGTWTVEPGDAIGVFLFNRLWRFGAAELVVEQGTKSICYRAPLLPFLPGHLART